MGATLASLIVDIKDAADMTNSEFVNDAGITRWINLELSELHDLIVNTQEDYFTSRYTFSSSSSSNEVLLPVDFYKMIKLFETTDGCRVSVPRFMLGDLEEDPDYLSAEGSPSYRIIGQKLYINPAGAYSFEMWYIPQFKKLVNTTDEINIAIPEGWEEFVIAGVAARCLAKEESDPSFFLQQKNGAAQRIQTMLTLRDAGPTAIVDIYRRDI